MAEFLALGLAAFNIALGLHYTANNLALSWAITVFSVPLGAALIWKFEGDEKLEKKQLDVAICLLLSLLGGLSAWLI
jgi:hypothetical protein